MDLTITAFALCAMTSLGMLISQNARFNLAALSLAFLGGFLILFEIWPLEQAAIVLVGGWMAVAVLGATAFGGSGQSEYEDAGAVFRLLLFGLLMLVTWTAAQQANALLPDITMESAWAGMLLASSGLVRSGIVQSPFQVVISLILAFVGFEIVFSYVSNAALMTALLAMAKLGLALIGAHLSTSNEDLEDTPS